ncbi:MAG: hypothetical protein JO154_25955 [Chitinophaga sp.]|uniref:GTP pyrophosphokinase n=1 Tax=Chitinophaga sp. TaxID=1869181 RepID=UPI0025BA0805|nr:hypothetical protein [Chitinophaga sp.]MBV8256067.1 hypothetical protein [Chitinophaga sp.]
MIDLKELRNQYSGVIHPLYSAFGKTIVDTIQDELEKKSIKIHGISYRAKGLDSLLKKIDKKSKYNLLEEVTDLCGVRVITYLESDVEKVYEIIKQTFAVDKDNSVDKRNKDADSFGYKSLHIVTSLLDTWSSAGIYARFTGLKAEIQVRSILQHAWAEIEHDLGYKADEELPYELKRGFHRLAAGLESADKEFDRLVEAKFKYQGSITSDMKNSSVQPILINSISLFEFLKEDRIFEEIREMMVKECGVIGFVEGKDYKEILARLRFLEIHTIQNLTEILNENEQQLKQFVKLLFKERSDRRSNTAVIDQSPLFYLLHYIAASKGEQTFNEYKDYGDFKLREVVNFLDLYKRSQLT